MKKLYVLCVMGVFLACNFVKAQDDEGTPVVFSGSVDTYFRTNLNAKNRGNAVEAPGTSFANLPGFGLGMVNLVAAKDGEKVGFVADMVFGPRGNDAVFNSLPSISSGVAVNQLYAYWNVSNAVTLTMGNFNTFLGYEVISPAANFNYSTSYMFSYGPFSHTGIKADFALSDELSAMVGVMNPTDFTEFNPFGSYTLGGQLGYSADHGSIFLNVLFGDQDGSIDEDQVDTAQVESAGNTFQVDVTTGWDVSERVYVGLNATYNTTSTGEVYDPVSDVVQDVDGDGAGFAGWAGYLQVKTSDVFSIGTRVEYFNVFNGGLDIIGLDTEGDGSVVSFTLSGNVHVGDLTLIPEFRLDATSEDSFANGGLEPSSSLASFLLAAIFSF